MGIVGKLKQVSLESLELCQQDPQIVDLFFEAEYLPESAFWQRSPDWKGESADKAKQEADRKFEKWRLYYSDGQRIRSLFLAEWEIAELDLDKNWQGFTFLLAGYTPIYVESEWTIPELRSQVTPQPQSLWEKVSRFFAPYENQNFFNFLVKTHSDWDNLPLVNAFGAGHEMQYKTGYDAVRYLLPSEVEEILEGLIDLGESGLRQRFERESGRDAPCPWIDWSEEEMIDWMTDYYREIVAYYQDAKTDQKAMLMYLT